jgi:hypothetical protein
MEYEDVGGTHKLYVNGVQMNLKGDPTSDIGGQKRTPIMGVDGRMHGTSVVVMPAKISGTLTDTSELDIIELRQMKNATVKLEKPNGKALVIVGACFSGDPSNTGAEGEITFEFSGPPGEEIS